MNSVICHLPSHSDLQEVLDLVIRQSGVPGIGIVVSVAGHRVSAFSGLAVSGKPEPLGPRSRFEVSCQMKLFVSLLILEMAARGILSLDDPIDRYLPELRKPLQQPVLLRHLLSHTSGFHGLDISDRRTRWSCNWKQFVEHFQNSSPHFPPGSVFNYEHSEHVLAGEIINRITGVSATQAVQDQLFEPLGIQSSRAVLDLRNAEGFVAQHRFDRAQGRFVAFSVPPFANFWHSSLPDMTVTLDGHVALAEALLGAHQCNAQAIAFSPFTMGALQNPVVELPRTIAKGMHVERIPRAFSTGCGHYRRGLLGHNGSMAGQACAVRMDPRYHLALAIGINAWAPYARDTVIDCTLALCLGERTTFARKPSRRPGFRLEELLLGFSVAEVSGRYAGSYHGQVSVSACNDDIKISFGDPAKHDATAYVRRGRGGFHVFDSPMPASLAFFVDPATNGPALMAGVHAYKRSS